MQTLFHCTERDNYTDSQVCTCSGKAEQLNGMCILMSGICNFYKLLEALIMGAYIYCCLTLYFHFLNRAFKWLWDTPVISASQYPDVIMWWLPYEQWRNIWKHCSSLPAYKWVYAACMTEQRAADRVVLTLSLRFYCPALSYVHISPLNYTVLQCNTLQYITLHCNMLHCSVV